MEVGVVFKIFSKDIDYLHDTAITIKDGGKWINDNPKKYEGFGNEIEFPEGKIITRLHKTRERRPKIVKLKNVKTTKL